MMAKQEEGGDTSSLETRRRCSPGDLETVPRRRRRACWKPFSIHRIRPGRRRRDGGSSHFVQTEETAGGGLFVHGINSIFSMRIFPFVFFLLPQRKKYKNISAAAEERKKNS
jgi:hypothetical protein